MEEDENGKVDWTVIWKGLPTLLILSFSYAIRNHQRIVDREDLIVRYFRKIVQ